MENISMWRVTPRCRCAGAQELWRSMPGIIQKSMKQSTSALLPISTDLRTPTRSVYKCIVSQGINDNAIAVFART